MNTDRHDGRKVQRNFNSPVGYLSINQSINKHMHCFFRGIQEMSVSPVSFCPVHILPLMRHVPYKSGRFTAVRVVITLSQLDYPEFDFRHGKLLFLFIEISRVSLGPIQPPTQLFPEFIPMGKVVGTCIGHSSLYTAEVRNEWSYTSTPKYAFMT